MNRLPVSWKLRHSPREPRAVVARGAVAHRLGRRLLALDDAALARLHGAVGPAALIAVTLDGELPWVDGVEYLAPAEGAPQLFVPTMMETAFHPLLLERAVARTSSLAPPYAVLLAPPEIFSMSGVGAIDRSLLADWVRGS